MSMPHPSTSDPSSQQNHGKPTGVIALRPVDDTWPVQSVHATLSANVASSAIDAPLKAEASSETPAIDDPALIVGLSLWTAPRHERYVASVAARNDGSIPHRYPTVLVDTLRRHADAGDPTCRLVLDWLLGKGLIETGAGRSSNEGAV